MCSFAVTILYTVFSTKSLFWFGIQTNGGKLVGFINTMVITSETDIMTTCWSCHMKNISHRSLSMSTLFLIFTDNMGVCLNEPVLGGVIDSS